MQLLNSIKMKENFRVKEKMLITGAGCGIGKTLAVQMARDGHELILHDSKQENLDSLILLLPLSSRYNILIADFTSEENVQEFLTTLKKEHTDLYGIISFAGIDTNKSLTCYLLSEINEMLVVNQKAPNLLTKSV